MALAQNLFGIYNRSLLDGSTPTVAFVKAYSRVFIDLPISQD